MSGKWVWLVAAVAACSAPAKTSGGGGDGDDDGDKPREVATPELPLKYGTIHGTRQCSADGDLVTVVQLYRSPPAGCESDWSGDAIWTNLFHGPADALPRDFTFVVPLAGGINHHGCFVDARIGGPCKPIAGTLRIDTLTPGKGATGTFEATLTDHHERATWTATWCGGSYDIVPCAHSAR